MSIKTSAAIRDVSDSLLALPLINNITSNSFYLAFAIIIVIVLIASFVFNDSNDWWTRCLRLAFWGYLAVLPLLMLKDRADVIASKNTSEERLMADLFRDRPGQQVPDGFVTTRANTLPGHSVNPYVSRTQLADMVEARARQLAEQMKNGEADGDVVDLVPPPDSSPAQPKETRT